MIVAIVGSRRYKPVRLIKAVVDHLEHEATGDVLTIVSGGEPTGVDAAVREECLQRGYHPCSEGDGINHLPMDYHFAELLPKDGSVRAKFARNSDVVRHVEMIVALYGAQERSPGTADTVAKARRAGLVVHEHLNGRWI